MQTENTALAALMALIETTDNDDVDTINDVLNEYPAVWNELFANYPYNQVDDTELTEQAIAAREHLASELGA